MLYAVARTRGHAEVIKLPKDSILARVKIYKSVQRVKDATKGYMVAQYISC